MLLLPFSVLTSRATLALFNSRYHHSSRSYYHQGLAAAGHANWKRRHLSLNFLFSPIWRQQSLSLQPTRHQHDQHLYFIPLLISIYPCIVLPLCEGLSTTAFVPFFTWLHFLGSSTSQLLFPSSTSLAAVWTKRDNSQLFHSIYPIISYHPHYPSMVLLLAGRCRRGGNNPNWKLLNSFRNNTQHHTR